MNEHDDDLESIVHEGADEETESYPDTEDELFDAATNVTKDEDGESNLDEDESEL